jgi:Carboxypeptidase regulatory-like domain
MSCPPLNELLDYARRLLTATERERVAAHLETDCQACAENMQWLTEVTSSSLEHPSYLLPAETPQGMMAWFRSQPPHESRSPLQVLARQLAAHLLFDSFAQSEWAMVRTHASDDGVAPERQMLFQTEGYDIELRFETTKDPQREDLRQDLMGQVLPQSAQPAANVTVELRQGDQSKHSAATDARGYFKFARLPRESYDLKIHVPEGEINIAQVTPGNPKN